MMSAKNLNHLVKDSFYDVAKSPVGDLWLVASEKGLQAVMWGRCFRDKEYKAVVSSVRRDVHADIICQTRQQLKEYFSGERKEFDLSLHLEGTDFQQKAWRALLTIPYGKTISYQGQAEKLGDKKKSRAVGMANSRNPISIIVPCHRVIAKSGELTGFAGGLDVKQTLIDHEARYLKLL